MNILKYVLISTVSLGIVSCGEAPKKEAKPKKNQGVYFFVVVDWIFGIKAGTKYKSISQLS